MGTHALASIIIVISIVVGIIVAVTSSVIVGVIIAVVGFGVGMILAILNTLRLMRNPTKMLPKGWR